VNLDDPRSYASVDPQEALPDVEATAEQWVEARRLADVRLDLGGIDAVVLTGMGGSGIAGDVTAALASVVPPGERTMPPLPVIVHKGYGLPPFVGPRTLVVALSYSGGTEETLSGVDVALDAGAQLFAVTAGGALAERAEAAGAPIVRIPGGRQPRHSLGYLAVPVLVALGLDEGLDEAIAVQAELATTVGRNVPTAENQAKQLALRLASGSVPLAWGARGLGAVAAYRLKCQLNENAKVPAIWNELPELDHNEVMGLQEWSPLAGILGLVLLRDPLGEHPRVAVRFTVTVELVRKRLAWTAEVAAHGTSPLARLASLLLLVDVASVYTALELGHDPSPIASIDRLKQALAEQ
jgi:glucose/mannose-6-phosphate isomerase